MKKKRFYNNKKRNSKWTEQPQGRKIDFADKYIDDGDNSDKFDNRRPTKKKKTFSKDNMLDALKKLIIFVCCFAVVCVGYTVMDVVMDRRSMPYADSRDKLHTGISDVSIDIKGMAVEPVALDGAAMLDAVIDDVLSDGYSSIAFDLKREDGTIGYASSLATINAYGAIATPSQKPEASVAALLENDILPVGVVACYKDNITPVSDIASAVYSGGDIYKDSQGSTYLNPNSDSAYNYIKSIIEEANGFGITIFVLDFCNLPQELGNGYDDGFEKLADRLYADIGRDIKLIEAKKVDITSEKAADIQKEVEEKIVKNNAENAMYCITAANRNEVKKLLDDKNILSYIISE